MGSRPPPLPVRQIPPAKVWQWPWVVALAAIAVPVAVWFVYVTFWLHLPLGESSRQFVEKLSTGQSNAAAAQCTTGFPRAQVNALITALSVQGPVRRVSAGYVWYLGAQHQNRYVYGLCGTLYFATGYRNYYIGFVHEGGGFRILEFDLDPSWVHDPIP